MDIQKLLHALDNDNNEAIVDLNYDKIAQDKNDMLQQLKLPRNELTYLHKQLKSYRLVNDMNDLRFGSYVRWISLKNPGEIKLTNGGIICDMKVIQEELHIKCKNKMNRLFQIKISEVILFQKLSEQEQIILKALKQLKD